MTQQVLVTHGVSTKNMGGIKAPFFDGSQPCAQIDPDLFFPETAGEALGIRATVKKICGSCEFQSACFEYAMKNNELGAWGGFLESERRNIRRKIKAS